MCPYFGMMALSTKAAQMETEANASHNQVKYEKGGRLRTAVLGLFFDRVAQHLGDGRLVLDAGSGEGYGAKELLKRVPDLRIMGVDLSATSLLKAKEVCPPLATCAADVRSLPFLAGSFDLVISLEVLEHLQDPVRAISAFKRITSRNILLTVPNEPVFRIQRMLMGMDIGSLGDHPEHINHWGLLSFKQFLVGQGLTIVEYFSPFPYAWVGALCRR